MQILSSDRAWIAWLAKVRIPVLVLLFGIELAITRLTVTNVPVRGFISLMVLWNTIAVFELFLAHTWRATEVQARLQIFTDLVFTTALLYITGDVDTSFNFIYALIVLVASLQLSRVWAYFTAGTAFVLFGVTLELTHYGIVHSYSISPRADDRSLHIVVAINLVAYFTVAYLASTLSAKLRQEDVEALENLQALHESIISSMSGGLISTDLDRSITFVNPSAERFLERLGRDLVGQSVDSLFDEPLPGLDTPQEKGEVHYHAPSGRERIFGFRASMLRVRERGDLGLIYSFADLTEIRRLESEVRMRDRLSAVGRMAAGIAHEIRNPLSSIAGSVKVLSGISTLNDEQRSLVSIVTRESERLNQIVSDFLVYSRDKKFRFAEQDLASLLNDTLTLLENDPRIAKSDGPRITILRNFEAQSAPAFVDGDKIKQVFWNLCENALRAMQEGGALTVSLLKQTGEWLISFRDTGHGISPAELERIFEPFHSRFEGGTGLGLAIVYQIVQAHGGEISARSTVGEGTEFVLRLARAAAAAPDAPAHPEPQAAMAKVANG
jgi:two-component system sensor histidine kinase PilS (NtrC family)